MMQQHQPNQNFNGGQQHQQQQQDPSKSVYVGNIAWRTTEQEIGDTFANFGYVNSVKIITDKETGRSKGFGFVEFADAQILHTVIQQMNGYNLNGRQLSGRLEKYLAFFCSIYLYRCQLFLVFFPTT